MAPAPDDVDDECGAVDEMRIVRGDLSTRKPTLALLCSPQFRCYVTGDRIVAAAVRSRLLNSQTYGFSLVITGYYISTKFIMLTFELCVGPPCLG